ncbi:sugar ABC transporter permease [Marivita sp. XM-24bin2]|jgi:multiple sugar transport system permease protein|uniref:carbohydrate ABC transporter permease n=1 Tax=unclassified Marivita TaxID=2632480 RepID=UPI000D79A66E|nr:sugar ABC transporter permease [Marivita sp. XM-24bin2]MCR9109806.1 sugar ABC transporter permease [Paracoccaceae bacterium]PWL33263.1 MAG: ABC transporter permease [Marivita sp. XM-24bin2]
MSNPELSDAGAAHAAPVQPTQRRFKRRSKRMKTLLPYMLVAPAVLYLMLITLYPGIFAITQSFYHVKFGPWQPAGFENYTRLMGDYQFWGALWNTLVIGSISLILQCVIALALAFYAYRDPWVQGWRIIFLIPMLFMPSAVAFIYKLAFLDGRVVADLLMRVGLIDGNIAYQSSTWLSRMILIIADVWQWTPFLFIIFVAGLQAQDEEVEEAARLDGASWYAIFWNISLPMMKPIIAVALILRAIDITTMFTNVFIITKGGPAFGTETISYFIYRTGFKFFNFGYASAASVIMLIITIIIAQFVVKRAFVSARA